MSDSKLKTAALWARAVSKSKERRNGTVGPAGSMLKPKMSFHTVATTLLENKKQSAREKELKAKQDEIDEVKVKFHKEQNERKKLQQDYDRLLSSQSDAGQKLVKANESLDKLRQENKKKTEQADKLQRNINIMEDRIRNLEIRASEVEKAELTLESTRKNLESSVNDCRTKDTEIRKLNSQNEETQKKLGTANGKISGLERKIDDLKLQVRHELMKNENIEKGLETIPHLKEAILERDKRIKQMEKEVDDKTALMIAARKAVRDYKDKLRDSDQKAEEAKSLEVELRLARCEVDTLKKLMSGKDSLVMQKCQALNLAKEVIDSLNSSTVDADRLAKIQRVLERLCTTVSQGNKAMENGYSVSPSPSKTTTTDRGGSAARSRMGQLRPSTSPHGSDSNKENMIDVNIPPYSGPTDHSHRHSPRPDRRAVSSRPQTANVRRCASFQESSSFHSKSPSSRSSTVRSSTNSSADSKVNGSKYRSESRTSSKYQPSLDYSLGVTDTRQKQTRPYSAVVYSHVEDSDSDTGSSLQDNAELMQRLSHEQRVALANMTAAEKDDLLMEAVNIGDRVSVSVPQKPPRYGRKKVKPVVYNGLVKYKGSLDKEYFDVRMYVGVKLDEPIGDSDGTYKGKRYMFTPSEHGKFFKMRDVTCVLNVQSGQYLPLGKLMVLHMMKKAQTNGESDSNHHGSVDSQ